ncbi:MAG: pentapeptide repeat-containing protein [Alphaproteobacteria bacterium]|nr:pentapeptide repeat-containing protein [Alphaproteobacteria bacterium]
MNKQESLALLAQGRDAWNAWAKGLLAERARLEEAGEWEAAEEEWEARAWVDFDDHEFEDDVFFGEFIFPGYSWFGGATFSGYAGFNGATFSGTAWFRDATFSGTAWFGQTKFTGYSTFRNAHFLGNVTFAATEVTSAFSLEGAVFELVPVFNQAHFDEAPRLDSLRIEPGGFVEKYRKVKQQSPDKDPWEHKPDFLFQALAASIAQLTGLSGNPDRAARWRALKRLAIQGHDHAREQEYFRGELLARRWHEDKPWHGSFWVGVLYQLLGSFGASVVRPVRWWLVSTAGFATAYLAIHLERASPLGPSGSSFRGAVQGLWDWAFTASPSLPCAIGPGDPAAAALGLSVSKGLFAGIGSVTKINQIHTCLYGVQVQVPGSVTPVIPDLVTGLGVLQFLLSAALVFLFGLALRNHFRIK